MADIANIIETSAKAIGEVVALGFVGFCGAEFGLLTHDALRYLSRLIYFVLMPALIFGLSQYMTVQNFREWWALPAFSCGHIIIAGFMAWVAAKLLRVKTKGEIRMMVLACSFDNWAAMPLTLLAGISNNWAKLSTDKTANARGQAMCVIYSIPWTMIFFSMGLKYLRGGEPPVPEALIKAPPVEPCPAAERRGYLTLRAAVEGDEDHEVRLLADMGANQNDTRRTTEIETGAASHRFDHLPKPKTKNANHQAISIGDGSKPLSPTKSHPMLDKAKAELFILLSVPSILAQLVSIVVGTVDPIRKTFFGEGALSWITDASVMFGKTIVPIATLVLGASMQNTVARIRASRRQKSLTVPVDDEHGEEHGEPGSRPVSPPTSGEGHDDHHSQGGATPSILVMSATIFVRLILLPAIFFPVSLIFVRSGILGKKVDPLLQLVILIQACMPGAEQIVVMYKLYGFTERAMSLSFIYLMEYILSIISISVCLVIAMSMIK